MVGCSIICIVTYVYMTVEFSVPALCDNAFPHTCDVPEVRFRNTAQRNLAQSKMKAAGVKLDSGRARERSGPADTRTPASSDPTTALPPGAPKPDSLDEKEADRLADKHAKRTSSPPDPSSSSRPRPNHICSACLPGRTGRASGQSSWRRWRFRAVSRSSCPVTTLRG